MTGDVQFSILRRTMSPSQSQFEHDIHLITAPIRFIRNLLLISVAILFAPLLLVWLIVGSHLKPQDCGIAKVVIGVFGPLVFCIWFAGVVRWIEHKSDKHPELGSVAGQSRASSLAAYFCGLGYLGVLVSLMNNLTGLQSLWAMVVGLFSPAILFAMWKVCVLVSTDAGQTTADDDGVRMNVYELEVLAKKLEKNTRLTLKEATWMEECERWNTF